MRKTSFVWVVMAVLLTACSLEKKNAVNRNLQNLTAHYNILFNANEILRQKQESYAASYIDSYNDILSVYQDTIAHVGSTADKDLASVTARANTIITVKEQSRYIGDAYMLLGKASFLNGDYFNATEYFGYVTRSFKPQADLVQQARVWQARSLIYLNQFEQAKPVLDTALLNINPKKSISADVYATRLEYEIKAGTYPEAEKMAKQALALSGNKTQRQRVTFILAQLQELNHEPADAYANYNRIASSNVPFVMGFNAELNRIRMEDAQNGRHISRADRLRSLLKNENDQEFADQIYYQLGELYLADNKVADAIKNYKLSVKFSTRNQNQKGLSYLRLADIYFKNEGDYVSAKNHYDSTLINLSTNYKGYRSIQIKADNLQLLADRLQTISREDTLQMLAKLDDKTRQARISVLVNKFKLTQPAAAAAPDPNDPFSSASAPSTNISTASNGGNSNFYFYNASAVSQGYTSFKRQWGNRKLEDNWRRSSRSNGDITNNTQNTTKEVDPSAVPRQLEKSEDDVAAASYRQELQQSIPFTQSQLVQSNIRIYNAYLDIANFYRDVLKDEPEAIATYELLLRRFPDDQNKAAIYYNLYRLYTMGNPAKSEDYKNRLLKDYPETPFAKVISDPDYAQHVGDRDAELNALYNQLYEVYSRRNYTEVIKRANDLLKQYPGNKLAAQMAYLRAIAAGHQEKLLPFRNDLQQIATQYPTDKLIGPLVTQHIAYVDAHTTEMSARRFALLDSDPNEAPFIPAPVVQAAPKQAADKPLPAAVVPAPAIQQQKPSAGLAAQQPAQVQAKAPANIQLANPPVISKAAPSVFNEHDSTNYYFVVNIASGSANVSSSRFGIGQFNRTNYQGINVKHQLKPVGDENQLIYVGRFFRLEDAKEYARHIIPLMPEIMKVPADKYSFFIITQENLDKLADQKMLDSYINYYQKNF